jgi:transposase
MRSPPHAGRGRSWRPWTRPRSRLWRPRAAQQIALQEYIDTIGEAERRVERLTEQIRELLPEWRRAPVVAALQALRGVSMVTAVTLVAEIGDITRFSNPRELMADLGLVPSEYSSGPKTRRGAITKAGNGTCAGCWPNRRGPTVDRREWDRRCCVARMGSRVPSWRSPGRRSFGLPGASDVSWHAASLDRKSPRPSLVRSPASCGISLGT